MTTEHDISRGIVEAGVTLHLDTLMRRERIATALLAGMAASAGLNTDSRHLLHAVDLAERLVEVLEQ